MKMEKTYTVTGLTTKEAELLDVALCIAAANPTGHTDGQSYKDLQRKIEKQFEEQD